MAPAHKSQLHETQAARLAWWASPLGAALIAAESQLLGEALEDVFGWELLQIGAWGPGRELLSGARTRHQAILAAPGLSASADIGARPTQLPVISDSIDAVLLPHILEFATDPYAIVREADRVLVGEGRLLVLGFRPFGLWGMRARWSRSGFPPGIRRVISGRRIREWLVLLGYEVISEQHYLFRGPWSGGLAADQDVGHGAGRMLRRGLTYPLPANAYLLKARKRVYTLTPIRPRFRERPAVLGGLVKPSPH